MPHLFLCSIGPVQDFIATARRSRDLWYGSWMLSELSKAAAKELEADRLIFPAPENASDLDPGSPLGVANKIVAVTDDDPDRAGQRVESAVKKRLQSLRESAFSKIEHKNKGKFDRRLAEKQVNDLLEFYWVAVPFPNGADYSRVRATAEALLAARKNTRNFRQVQGAYQPKSSLDGSRESVIPEEQYPRSESDRIHKAKMLYRHFHARPGERLSGVDLMKRVGEPEGENPPKFHSTSHFAALPFMAMLNRKYPPQQIREMLAEISKAYTSVGWHVSDLPNDGSLLYESRLADSIPPGDELEQLRTELNRILEKRVGAQRPSPYYALLRADGDNMGVIIDGQKGIEAHRELSKKLSNFARAVPEIVEKHQGKAIYAGGDDILVYLPLHTALECAVELDARFQAAMQNFKGINLQGREVRPSLSAGIVVAHHLTPLSDVLAMSRDAEKTAKRVPGKNALVIVLSKRSGADREIAGKWGPLNARLQKLIQFHRSKAISKGTAYELQTLDRTLAEANISAEAIRREALRIIQRKYESGGDEKAKAAVTDQFEHWLETDRVPIGDLALEMIVANTFATALDMAAGKLPANQEEAQ